MQYSVRYMISSLRMTTPKFISLSPTPHLNSRWYQQPVAHLLFQISSAQQLPCLCWWHVHPWSCSDQKPWSHARLPSFLSIPCLVQSQSLPYHLHWSPGPFHHHLTLELVFSKLSLLSRLPLRVYSQQNSQSESPKIYVSLNPFYGSSFHSE